MTEPRDDYREMFEGLHQAALAIRAAGEAIIAATEGVIRATEAALRVKDDHEDLRDHVIKLEAMILELIRKQEEGK